MSNANKFIKNNFVIDKLTTNTISITDKLTANIVSVTTTINDLKFPSVNANDNEFLVNTGIDFLHSGNIIYDSWVLLDDDIDEGVQKKVTTFEKMLYTNDFEKNKGGVPSLLNSISIYRI